MDGPPPEVIHVNPENFPNIDDYDGLILQSAWQRQTLVGQGVMLAEWDEPQGRFAAGAQGLMQRCHPAGAWV